MAVLEASRRKSVVSVGDIIVTPTFVVTEVTPRPKGGIVLTGDLDTSSSWQNISGSIGSIARTITSGKIFHPASIFASCNQDVEVRVIFDTQTIFPPTIITAKIPFSHWFPMGFAEGVISGGIYGNGSKQLKMQAEYPSGGSSGKIYAQLLGEEVATSVS